MESTTSIIALKNKVADLEAEFSLIQARVYQKLEEKPESIGTVRQFINSLSVSQRENIPYFDRHMQEILNYSTLEEVFSFLTRKGVWSFLNSHILEKIVEQFNLEGLDRALQEYNDKVDDFKKQTKLGDFLEVWSGRSIHETSDGHLHTDGRIPIVAKFGSRWEDYTLAQVADSENQLANAFLLHKLILDFQSASPGCIAVTWLVPLSVLEAVKRALKHKKPDLKKMNIQELVIGNLLFTVSILYSKYGILHGVIFLVPLHL